MENLRPQNFFFIINGLRHSDNAHNVKGNANMKIIKGKAQILNKINTISRKTADYRNLIQQVAVSAIAHHQGGSGDSSLIDTLLDEMDRETLTADSIRVRQWVEHHVPLIRQKDDNGKPVFRNRRNRQQKSIKFPTDWLEKMSVNVWWMYGRKPAKTPTIRQPKPLTDVLATVAKTMAPSIAAHGYSMGDVNRIIAANLFGNLQDAFKDDAVIKRLADLKLKPVTLIQPLTPAQKAVETRKRKATATAAAKAAKRDAKAAKAKADRLRKTLPDSADKAA